MQRNTTFVRRVTSSPSRLALPASGRPPSRRHGINPKTVVKWKRRTSTDNAPMGPKTARSAVLSQAEEAIVVAFRRHTLLPLDDCLYALQATIPRLKHDGGDPLFDKGEARILSWSSETVRLWDAATG